MHNIHGCKSKMVFSDLMSNVNYRGIAMSNPYQDAKYFQTFDETAS